MRAHPGASRERVSWEGGVLHVWVTARAVEGAANRALLAAVARALGTRPSAVALVTGERGRDKVVEVDGLAAGALDRLPQPPSPRPNPPPRGGRES